MKVGRVALDGTKVKANASKHKAMSYDRMVEKQKQLKAEVKQLLEQAEAADAEEDAAARQGPARRRTAGGTGAARDAAEEDPEAKRALEATAREKAAAEGSDPKQAKPKEKDQYNFTDPESRIMKGADGFVQAYNAQAAVEPDSPADRGPGRDAGRHQRQGTIAADGERSSNEQSGQRPEEMLADSGYCSEKNLEALESADPSPERRIMGTSPRNGRSMTNTGACPRGRCRKSATRVDRMRRKLTDQSRQGGVRGAQGDRGTGVRSDQASARVPAVPAAWHRKGARRMVAGMPDAQHPEVVPPLLRVNPPGNIADQLLKYSTKPLSGSVLPIQHF